MEVIVYVMKGSVVVMNPAPNAGLTVKEIAEKDVPEGVKYWIIDNGDLPQGEPQQSWEINETGSGNITVGVDPVKLKAIQVQEAEEQRQAMIAEANAYINSQNWPSKLALGRLKDEDKAKFNAWLDYIDAVTAVSISAAPDISWPEQPDK